MPQPLHPRETYLRFVIGADADPAHRLGGLFVLPRTSLNEVHVPKSASDQLEQLYEWFDAELPCPPFATEKFPAAALCWFRPAAARFIQRMWELTALLREQGRPVRVLKSEDPGQIVYRDKYQVVAIPRACSHRESYRALPSQDLGAPRPLRWTKLARAKARRELGGTGTMPVPRLSSSALRETSSRIFR